MFNIVKNIAPSLIADDIVGVQPMSSYYISEEEYNHWKNLGVELLKSRNVVYESTNIYPSWIDIYSLDEVIDKKLNLDIKV